MVESALDQQWRELSREPPFGRLSPSTVRAAWWAFRALRRARRDLRRDGLAAARVKPPPALSWGSRTGVNGVLRRVDPTCLERCVVQQMWLSAHGIRRSVRVGVLSSSGQDIRAHAWIDGMTDPAEFEGYTIIHTIDAP